jgi:hypothetical protein
MVYEAYPMIVHNLDFDIEEECDETRFLEEFHPYSLKIQIIAADIVISHLSCSSIRYGNLASLQLQAKRSKDLEKVQLINQYIASKGWNWIAGDNKLLAQYYFVKATQFGFEKYNVRGFDFYISGEFKYVSSRDFIMNSGTLRNEFNWISKHDANVPGTPYYSEEGEGWLTGLRSQYDCGACWVFSSIASVEAVANLYFNQHCDYDLSEHDVLCCSGGGTCEGGSTSDALDYLNITGTFNEENYPYNENGPWYYHECCDDNLGNPAYNLKCGPPSEVLKSLDIIKTSLINKGPIVTSILNESLRLHHAVSLIAYYTDEENYLWFRFKDSDQARYWTTRLAWSDIENMYSVGTSITIADGPTPERIKWDMDNDGYYNWGIGSFPPGWVPPCDQQTEPDWNDHDKHTGPHDANYEGIPINPGIKVNFISGQSLTSESVTANSFLSFCSNDLFNGHELHFRIENPGNAQLNLDRVQVSEHGKVEIIYVPGGSPDFDITEENLPSYKICKSSQSDFIVDYTGTEQGDLTKIKIHVNEDVDLPDFEFILLHNDCITEPGIIRITQDDTWSGYELKTMDYQVVSGVTLRVTGEIAMSPYSDIFVEPGASLIIDGGRLTSTCGGLWNGIDLWGDWRRPQVDEDQGTIRVINGGIIEFARCGVENIIYNVNLSICTGGIIYADHRVFKDNLIGVRFWPYHNYVPISHRQIDNFSRIKNSEFVTTSELYERGFDPQKFISMQEVEGISILGCNFHNQLESSELSQNQRSGYGISATEAQFIINNICLDPIVIPCLGYKPCRFQNLEYGIWAGYTTTSLTTIIRNSEFINNLTGIDLYASTSADIAQNIFEVRKADQVPFYETTYCGLYLDNSTGYKVQENSFFTFLNEQQKENQVSVGLTINNSGEENNEIYNNAFDGLYTGIIAQEVNRNEEGNHGLQIKCNNFSNGIFDIAVTKDIQSTGITGIARDQGSGENVIDPTLPAGNRFTFIEPGENPENEGNYFNSCENITYWHHADANGFNIIPDRHTPAPMVDPKPEGYGKKFKPEQSCPSNLSGGGSGILEQKANMISFSQKADSIQTLLGLLIDGGNTEGLLSDIQNCWPEDAYELYSGMISKSPYLSDTSMIKAIEKEDVLLSGMITDVLVANPQSAKSERVMSTVDGRSNPLTEDQLADIGEGRFIHGAKESLQSQHSRYLYLKDILKNDLVSLYKSDTLSESPIDSIINILNIQSNLTNEYLKAFEYLKKGDSAYVINTLDDIPLNYNLTVPQENEHELYQDYFNLLLSQDTVNSAIFKMDSLDKSNVYQVMNSSNGLLKSLARNILIANDSLDYVRQILLPRPGLKSAKVRIWPVKQIQSENVMKIYPNPAKNLVILEILLKDEPINASINFTDIRGVILKSYLLENQFDYLVIPLSDFPAGNVFCQLTINNIITEVRKLIIAK